MAFSLALLGASTYKEPASGSYDLLSTTILTSNQASVTFAGLGTYAADYQHLQIRASHRDTRTGNNSSVAIARFNSASSTYRVHWLIGDGSSVSSGGTAYSGVFLGYNSSNSSPTNNFAASVLDILDPFNTSKNTTTRTLTGHSAGGIRLISGLWVDTSSITSIQIISDDSNNFVTGSRFSLYGLRKV